jgi:hypothetical protein
MAVVGVGTIVECFGMTFGSDPAQADIAQVAANILNDLVNGNPIVPGAWSNTGLLYIPNRGVLVARPGDWVIYDPTGWPVLVSPGSFTNSWTT